MGVPDLVTRNAEIHRDHITTEHSDHPSEQEGLRIVEDAAILNDGTIEELKEQVDEAVDKLFDEMGQNNLRRSASCL